MKISHFNFNYHFNWWTIPLIGCLKFNLKCVHVWRDPGIWSECVWSYAWYEHAFSACVCVCVLTEFWSFCTLKADVMMSERQRERAQISKLTKQDTLHTHRSLNMLTEQCECCVCLYVRLCVCFACQWLALLLSIFSCCGDNVATGDISFELTHTLSLSFFLYHSFSFQNSLVK